MMMRREVSTPLAKKKALLGIEFVGNGSCVTEFRNGKSYTNGKISLI